MKFAVINNKIWGIVSIRYDTYEGINETEILQGLKMQLQMSSAQDQSNNHAVVQAPIYRSYYSIYKKSDKDVNTLSLCFQFNSEIDTIVTIYPFVIMMENLKNKIFYYPISRSHSPIKCHFSPGSNIAFPNKLFTLQMGSQLDGLLNQRYLKYRHIVIEIAPEKPKQYKVEKYIIECDIVKSTANYSLRIKSNILQLDNFLYDMKEMFYDQSDSEEAVPLCVVCCSNRKDTLILPCRHLCLCREDANHIRMTTGKCPLCRTGIRLQRG